MLETSLPWGIVVLREGRRLHTIFIFSEVGTSRIGLHACHEDLWGFL